MKYAVDGKTMKLIDSDTINKVGIPSLVLMERAAYSVYEEIIKHAESSGRILIICGSGNNGADGVALARILNENGYVSDIYFAGNEEHYTEEMKLQSDIAHKIGLNIVKETRFCEYNIVVDAIFGIGLSREISGKYKELIEKMSGCDALKIAIDISSGINSGTGEIMGIAVKNDITVTFGTFKTGMLLYPAAEYSGEIIVKNPGFPEFVIEKNNQGVYVTEKTDVQRMLPKRYPDSHKGTYGKILVIAGSVNMSGAAILSGIAAYRSGCGLVKICTAEENREIIQISVPEAVMLTYGSDENDIDRIKNEIEMSTAIVCGPGIGKGEIAAKIVEAVLRSGKKAVIDADALNIISENQYLKEYYNENIVITPHIMEFSRLTGLTIKEIKADSIVACRNYAEKNKITCVLKDSRTVIADSSGNVFINTSGNSGMSTAGSGDVLAGITGSLLGQGMSVTEGAALGAYIHGLAGDAARNKFGERGMTAGDICESIASVI